MGSKRAKKKLAKQRNNAGGKYAPAVNVSPGKKGVPHNATTPRDYQDELVRWSVREIDTTPGAGGWRWSLQAKETKEVLSFLEEVSKKTWKECLTETVSSGRKKRARNHEHKVEDLSTPAQERLRELAVMEDRIFRFRLSGKARLWGLRSGSLFQVLWYDPEHQVYPVEKRNT